MSAAAAAGIDWSLIQPEKKWTILRHQKRFLIWAVYTSIGCMMMGFDWGIAGTATAMPAFQQVMGVPFPSMPSGYLIPASIQSAWSGVGVGADLIGVALSGQLMDRIGRRWTVLIGIILTAVGIAVQIAAVDWKVFLVGRMLNAFGFGMTFIVSPVWIGENVRPELRGLFLCFQNGSVVMGQFILALAAYGSANIVGKWSYQLLIVLQFVFVLALAIGFPWFPESPYYHLAIRKNEVAGRKALEMVHGSHDQALIDAELARIRLVIAANEETAALAGMTGQPFLQMWKGTNLRRTMIAMLGPLGQQFIGAAFVLGYITYFLSLLGIQDYFTVNAVLFVFMLLSNAAAFPLIEMVGRRPLLLTGIAVLTVSELLMGIMGVIVNAAALWVILVCIFLWAIFYQFSLGAVGFALTAEVPAPHLRAITISTVSVFQCVIGWLIGFISPYMINPDAGNLGGKVGFVFAGFGVPLCVLFFFLIPETKGLTLDEIDILFNEKIPSRHFKREGLARKAAGGMFSTREMDIKKGDVVQVDTVETAAAV